MRTVRLMKIGAATAMLAASTASLATVLVVRAAGPSAPAGACGNEARNQISTIMEKIVVPARCRNIFARV